MKKRDVSPEVLKTEEKINELKIQLDALGQMFIKTRDQRCYNLCEVLVEKINDLEEKIYGMRITDITFIL